MQPAASDAVNPDAVNPDAVNPALRREVERLVERVRPWDLRRWGAACLTVPGRSRADVGFHLAQVLTGAAQRLEGVGPYELPRLSDPAVAHQLAVTADDLLRAAPPPDVARAMLAEVVLHRHDLDGSGWPRPIADLLGFTLDDARAACALGPAPTQPPVPPK